ncbi:AP-3 complex subunit beta [Coemansia sp. RSA 552]|nr:AP-3 complex subunit beta [Coemansia sp. RSA 552]
MADYLSRAMALAQDAAKLSRRVSEGLVDNALEFGLDTPGSFYDNVEYRLGQVRPELESGTGRERITAMKRLLAAAAKGIDVSEYFAAVVKNVAAGSLELRRLVYIYVLRYAEQQQDLALLAVNTFQRDAADADAGIRAMALRVLSSIRVPALAPLVVVSVRKAAKDVSPHVRKTAALAIPKVLRLDPELRSELQDLVDDMLGEASPLALGAVVRAVRAVGRSDYSLIHGHFRRWCALLPAADEWGQIELVKLLTAYARTQFTACEPLEPDHELLLGAVQPLLQSRNGAVAMAAVATHVHVAPANRLGLVARPLVRLVRASREAGAVALPVALHVAQRQPVALHAHVRSFFVAAGDAPFTRRLKLRVLAALAAPETARALAPELVAYTQSSRVDVAAGAAHVLAACAQRGADSCVSRLVALAADGRPDVAGAAIQSLRVLMLDGTVRDMPAQSRVALYDVLSYLARMLEQGCAGDSARAHVVALVTDFAASRFGCMHGLDILRRGARGFADEGALTKMQLLELATRLEMAVREEGPVVSESAGELGAAPEEPGKAGSPSLPSALREHGDVLDALHTYIFTLARYDVSFDVRDRARSLRALCPPSSDRGTRTEELPALAAAASDLYGSAASVPALAPPAPAPLREPEYSVGSLSLTIGLPMPGYEPLPDWPTSRPAPVDRGPSPGTQVSAVAEQPISIAGLSGRPRPAAASADFSTPRSAAEDDDLDAFLNAEDDVRPRASPAVLTKPPAAVIFAQETLTSTDDDLSTSDFETSSDDDSTGDESPERVARPPEGAGEPALTSESASGSESASSGSEDQSEGESEGETNPFLGPSDDRPADGDRPEHAQPLMEDTSKYWQ